MKTNLIIIVCSGALMGCWGDADPTRFAGSGQIANIPTEDQRYSGDVDSISYNPTTGTLTVLGDPFDLAGTFSRRPQRDVRGFAAFENDGGARRYLALVRTDPDHGLSAGVVGTPFRLDNEFGGTMLARDKTPELPRNVEVRHVGDYAGIRNVGTNDGADMSNSFLHRVEGRVQLDLDFFADSPGIEGVIFNRLSVDETVMIDDKKRNITYDDVVLRFTTFDDEGNFEGDAAVSGTVLGRYDGMIAGDDAAASAGVLVMVESGELERGGFIARAQ